MSILDKILLKKKNRLEIKKTLIPLNKLKEDVQFHQKIIKLEEVLDNNTITLIAEMKRQSPSAGIMDTKFIPNKQAEIYIKSGADAISVLTEEDFFRGSNKDLIDVLKVSKNKRIPVLQKDFIFDEYQLYEAKKLGADCVLLIVRILEEKKYIQLYKLAKLLGLSVIVEIFDESEIQKALSIDIEIIGINNRNLATLKTSLDNFVKLSKLIPKDIFKIAESGISNHNDALKMVSNGANGLLVGESIMKSNDIGRIIKDIKENKNEN